MVFTTNLINCRKNAFSALAFMNVTAIFLEICNISFEKLGEVKYHTFI